MPVPPLGALATSDGVQFRVWAPKADRVHLVLEDEDTAFPMAAQDHGYFERFVPDLHAGARYRYRLDEEHLFPDPASRYQPDGVHGASMVIDPSTYAWQDADWKGIPQNDLVFYEVHVGTFTPEGTFRGVQDRLPYLHELGITALEIMPVADFPGRWNWGYDQAALYAPSRAYGTPDDLRALVDAAHQMGLAVFLDVIYNHLGPDGAYVAAFAPMFTDKHQTPWGPAINLDDVHSEGVRSFFIDNALHWLREYHVDGFRLDATHAIVDDSEPHFLAELAEAVAQIDEGPPRYLIAEDHRNLNVLVRPRSQNGYGLDATWSDDVHHQIRNLTAGDHEGYYADFANSTADDIAEALQKGWYYDGKWSPTMQQVRGTDASNVRHDQCVIFIQNHDQVGNRPAGDRLHHDIPLPVYRAASALLLFAPGLPLLFMGQEWAASTPFQFFTDHHAELGEQVRQGRKEEFRGFSGFDGDVPDPQAETTFQRSKLRWEELDQPEHEQMHALYRDLLALRRELTGPFHAEAHGAYGLHLQRGPHHLLVALDDDVTMPMPYNTQTVWHTEQPAYALDGRPPESQGDDIYFPTAGAMVLRMGD